jgi:hypothetical protein
VKNTFFTMNLYWHFVSANLGSKPCQHISENSFGHQKPSKTQQFPQFHRFYRPFKLPQSSTALAQHRGTAGALPARFGGLGCVRGCGAGSH